jgi:hypothetical protein
VRATSGVSSASTSATTTVDVPTSRWTWTRRNPDRSSARPWARSWRLRRSAGSTITTSGERPEVRLVDRHSGCRRRDGPVCPRAPFTIPHTPTRPRLAQDDPPARRSPVRGTGLLDPRWPASPAMGVESRGGISPPRAHGTGREPLSSSGSYRPAAGLAPKRQWVSNAPSRAATRPNQRDARTQRPRKRLYFRIAHFTRAKVKLRPRTSRHRDR